MRIARFRPADWLPSRLGQACSIYSPMVTVDLQDSESNKIKKTAKVPSVLQAVGEIVVTRLSLRQAREGSLFVAASCALVRPFKRPLQILQICRVEAIICRLVCSWSLEPQTPPNATGTPTTIGHHLLGQTPHSDSKNPSPPHKIKYTHLYIK